MLRERLKLKMENVETRTAAQSSPSNVQNEVSLQQKRSEQMGFQAGQQRTNINIAERQNLRRPVQVGERDPARLSCVGLAQPSFAQGRKKSKGEGDDEMVPGESMEFPDCGQDAVTHAATHAATQGVYTGSQAGNNGNVARTR
ncbi:hypothetical protein R1flu_021870 [Riccia fluitans]|uniref:Uncharacterized protein n=1 Tax=Riccia fluitans TaxID=41844 RepID=A0ABD1ZR83_9MARC